MQFFGLITATRAANMVEPRSLRPEGPLPGVGSPVPLEEPLLTEGHLAHPAGECLQHLLTPAPQAVLQRRDL